METNARPPIRLLAICLVVMFLQIGTGGAQNTASQQAWQGFVTDTHCRTNCQVTKDASIVILLSTQGHPVHREGA